MRYLLDTNHWVAFFKGYDKLLGVKIENTPSETITICSIVRAELLHGAQKYGNPDRRIDKVERTLAPFESFAFDDAAADRYALIRHELELKGSIIGPYDLQIAAICLANDITLVTGNEGEFSRVTGLVVENWLTVTG